MRKSILYKAGYILCILVFSVLSCKKSPDTNATIPGTAMAIPAATPVNGNLSGRVYDENDLPVNAAVVECSGVMVNSDSNGFFDINNVTLDKYISTVTITKPGYFKAYRSFSANASRNIVNIKLIPKTLTGSISSSSGGSITLPNSTAVNFLANSIVIKSSGAAYNGTVNIYAAYIDPTADDIAMTVPGSFIGRDANNLYALASTGMLALEMESDAGEPLQLEANKPAMVKLTIPSFLLSKAPHTIDTWSLDEKGIWKKEGIAVKTGGHYEFEATHFSFWNCDYPNNAIYLNMHVEDSSGNAIPSTLITLTVQDNIGNFPSSRSGFTDPDGNVSGLVPGGLDLLLTASIATPATQCTSPQISYYNEHIGPFNDDASVTIHVSGNLSTIPAQSLIQHLTVSGTANNCAGQPLQNGYALIYTGQSYVYVNVLNGNYSATLTQCSPFTSVSVAVRDSSYIYQSTTYYSVVSGNTITIPLLTVVCPGPPIPPGQLNTYDGIYEVTGTFMDVVGGPAFTGLYPKQYHLITTSTTSVNVATLINGSMDPGLLFLNNGAGTYFGNFGLVLSFDPTTNLISEMHNYYGDPNNPLTGVGDPSLGSGPPLYQAAPPRLRTAGLDATGFNDYNPTTKVIRVKYFQYQADVATYPGPRTLIDETWTYIGPR